MSENAKWYVIHTYSGYENAVKTSIEKFVNGRGMEDMILRMEIPVETVKEVSESGEAKEVERRHAHRVHRSAAQGYRYCPRVYSAYAGHRSRYEHTRCDL